MDFHQYITDIAAQDAQALRGYFHADAEICWPCTDELFTVEEFLRANCEYPGTWGGELLRETRCADGGAVTVARIFQTDGDFSCHVTSFFTLRDGKIAALTEYYADDGEAPQWRREMHIGRPLSGLRHA